MYLNKNVSINLPEDQFSQEMSTFLGKKSIKIKSITGVNHEAYISDLDIHVDVLFKTSIQAAFPIMLYLTEGAIELSIELTEFGYLEIGTYNRDPEGVHQLLEILEGIRFHNAPINITQISVETAKQRCLSALEADEAKKAREHEKALKRGAAIPGAYTVYDEDIAFDLPNGYEFYWKDLGDGEKDGRIVTDIAVQEDGEKNPEYMIVVEHGTAREPRNDFFEAAVANILENASNAISCRLSHDPETVLYTSFNKISIFNTVTSTIGINVLVFVTSNKLLNMTWGSIPSIATPDNYGCMEKMLKAVRAIRIHGKPIRLENVDARTLWTNMYPQEHDGKVYEYPLGIDLEVKYNGETVSRKTIHEPKSAKKDVTTDEKNSDAKADVNHLTHSEDPEEEIRRMRENSTVNKPASLAELQRMNPNINWSRMEKYIRKTYNMTPAAWFKAEGIIGQGKKAAPELKETPAVKPSANPTVVPEMPKNAGNTTQANQTGPKILNLNNSTIIKENQFMLDETQGKIIIPEGVVEIQAGAFGAAAMNAIVFPRSLRKIGMLAFTMCQNLSSVEFQEGLETIEPSAFRECPLLNDIYLPNSIKYVSEDAFVKSSSEETTSNITVHLSGKAAMALIHSDNNYLDTPVIAKEFIIDGISYRDLLEYEKKQQSLRQQEEKNRREREEQARRRAAEDARNSQIAELRKEIAALEAEKNGLKGLFAVIKRQSLKKRIDNLKAKLSQL